MNRKADFEMPITYIYVVIVGGFALFFFATIAFNQGEAGLQQNSIDMARYFDAVIENLGEQTNTMGYTDELVYERFNILTGTDGRNRISYRNNEQLLKSHVFSERELQGRLSYWAYPLKIGYTSSNMLFLTDNRMLYVILFNNTATQAENALRDYIERELPSAYEQYFNLFIGDNAGLSFHRLANTNLPSETKYICVGSADPPGTNCNVNIVPSSEENPQFGTIKFFPYTTDYSYYGLGMMMAATFSYNETYYSNTINLMFQRHKITGEVLIGKADKLENEYSDCPIAYYPGLRAELTIIKELRHLGSVNSDDATELSDSINSFLGYNDDLLRNINCVNVV